MKKECLYIKLLLTEKYIILNLITMQKLTYNQFITTDYQKYGIWLICCVSIAHNLEIKIFKYEHF